MAKITAVIDIGSNSVRMAVYKKTSALGFYLLDEVKSRVRLSENSYKNNSFLQPEPMRRALLAIGDFLQVARSLKARKILCVATSAVRDAPNKAEFLTLVRQKYGLRIHTMRFNPKPSRIPNEEDAPLSTSVDLTKLSDATAGQSFQSAHELLERLNKKQTKIRKELFVYPLAFAIFALIFAFFSAPSFLILLAFIPAPSEAFSLDFASEARARQFYKEQKYQDAIREYSSIKGASKAQQARIFYNIANAHFMLKNYDAAAQFYKRSLQYGDLKQARKNLALLHDKPRSKEEKIATKYQKHKVQIKDSPFFLEPSKRGKSANSW